MSGHEVRISERGQPTALFFVKTNEVQIFLVCTPFLIYKHFNIANPSNLCYNSLNHHTIEL